MKRARDLLFVFGFGILLTSWPLGCRRAPPQARLPEGSEVGPESVVVNYAPQRLRLFAPAPRPDAAPQGYVILGSARPELPAALVPLGNTAQKAPSVFFARPDRWTFVADHVVEALSPPPGATSVRFSVYDAAGKSATPVEVKLPMPCAPSEPALLSTDGVHLYAAVRCAKDSDVVLLSLDDKAQLIAAKPVQGASRAELFLHQPDADYVLSGRQVLRVKAGSSELPAIGAVPTPDDGPTPARELLRAGSLILVVDGRAGRVTALDAGDMAWRFEKRFAVGPGVRAVRATLGAPGRLYVVTVEDTAQGPTLFASVIAVQTQSQGQSAASPPRILLGKAQSDGTLIPPELVPIAEAAGGGALLVFVQPGNRGPQVALRQLTL